MKSLFSGKEIADKLGVVKNSNNVSKKHKHPIALFRSGETRSTVWIFRNSLVFPAGTGLLSLFLG